MFTSAPGELYCSTICERAAAMARCMPGCGWLVKAADETAERTPAGRCPE
jgi:hypothetical protein